ncbi:MAG TPA: L-threonylcarbamoyladenylate synthase [archaeon]|nr:L-threonylcarbamoyladenylate synthase [archaeon]
MQTKIIEVNPQHPEKEKIEQAAKIIKAGGLVAFPTETVYGLGADALNKDSFKKIYGAKNRPSDNPIIVHVARKEDLKEIVANVPEIAEILIKKFWPGPLTLLFKKKKNVPAPKGMDTIAVRMPSHKIALALIKNSAPIAAPSANLSGKPSPTTAQHVIDDLNGRIDMIIDGGPVEIGVESTVLDITKKVPMILRPGGVTYEQLKKVLGKIEIHPSINSRLKLKRVASPGMKYRHYAPNAEMIVFEGKEKNIVKKINDMVGRYENKKVGILATKETAAKYSKHFMVKVMGSRKIPKSIAKNLFSMLREFDKEDVQIIFAEGISTSGIGLGVMNRIRKAAGYRIVEA